MVGITNFCCEFVDLEVFNRKIHHQQNGFLSKSFATATLEEVK